MVTPVLRSVRPTKEDRGQRLGWGRSRSLISVMSAPIGIMSALPYVSTTGLMSASPYASPPMPTRYRSRAPPSKLFSSSLDPPAISSSTALVHPLRNTYVCFPPTLTDLLCNSADGSFGSVSSVHPGSRMSTTRRASKKSLHLARSVYPRLQNQIVHPPFLLQVESFWSIWTHLTPPSALQPTTDYLLFHVGVRKPVWEDPLNISGGKWIIRLRKGIADRLWEDLVMAVIGDQFDECTGRGDPDPPEREDGLCYPEICGCTISVRQNEDIISLWNRFEVDFRVREKIRWVSSIKAAGHYLNYLAA